MSRRLSKSGSDRSPRVTEAELAEADNLAELVECDEVPTVAWPLLLRQRREKALSKLEKRDSYRWIVLVIVLIAFFAGGFSITVVSVSLPTIGRDFGASDATVAWVLSGALLAFGIATPTMGRAGDVFGHKRLYLIGTALSAILAALVAVSWNIGSLITFRIIWAAAGAAAGPASMALIMEVFDAAERVKAMGWWSFVGAGAPVIGVVAGGPIVEAYTWRWVFAAQVPISLIAFIGGLWFLRNTVSQESARFDIAGSVMVTITAATFLIGINRGGEWGWTHPVTLACFAVAPIAAWLFLRIEKRASSPLLPPNLMKLKAFNSPLLVQFCGNFAYIGAFLITPFYLQRVLEFSLTKTGIFMLPRPVSFSLAAPISGYVAIRLGERRTVMAGMAAITASMVMLSIGSVAAIPAGIVIGLVLSGVGLGGSSPSLTSSVANSVPREYLGVAGAAISMMATVGGVVGMEVLRTIATAAGGTSRAYGIAYGIGGCVAVAAFVLARRITRLERSPASPSD